MELIKNQIYFSRGTNLGDKPVNREMASQHIGNIIGKVKAVSRIFESVPWGFSSDHIFYNRCLRVESGMPVGEIMIHLLEIEMAMGRVRMEHGYADRLIDIDLLLFGEEVINLPEVRVPHPRMGERRFVMEPLAEIAPEVIHPVSGRTIMEMLKSCPDQGVVSPV